MSYQILFYVDYDQDSGLGHVSRARAFLEALSDFGVQVTFSSNLNPIELEPQMEFLRGVTWVTPQAAARMSFDLLYIDTYNFIKLNEFSQWATKIKVLVIDSNFTYGMPDWADLIIDLECSSARNIGYGGSYFFGDIFPHSELALVKEKRRSVSERIADNSYLNAVVNFGGSIKAEPFIKELSKTFLQSQNITYNVYCPSGLFESLTSYFFLCKNVEIKPFSPSYFKDISNCDFLITSSGTSFIEGLFAEIPMVIFNLFTNAKNNFERLGHSTSVLYLGSPAEIPSEWQEKALDSLRSGNGNQQNDSVVPEIKIVEKSTLESEISILLGFKNTV